MKRIHLLLTFWLCLLISAKAQDRQALVVGNGNYEYSRKLVNPPRDAAAMAGKLRAAGFEVTEVYNTEHEELENTFKEFSRKLTPSSTALVFFAGHGMQVFGVSYLLPVDAKVDEETALKYEAVPLDMVLDLLDRRGEGAGLKIVMLDCCRNNPFGRGWRGNRDAAGTTGMAAPTSTPQGTILCFATDPGKVAKDGSAENSPYTEGLLNHLFTPGLDIDLALRRAGAEVQLATNQVQNPWRNSNFNGEFALVSKVDAPSSTTPPVAMLTKPEPPVSQVTPATATKDRPFVNSLGMKFVPVPGTDVLFCIWETRVQDYAAYAAANPGVGMEWKDYEFEGHGQGPDHPVVNVSWEDAKAFCEWLSKKEGMTYRLPTDHEWSLAVGIGDRENRSASPKDKDEKIVDVYPWGSAWPPPPNAGNFSGEESAWSYKIDGYRDSFPFTAPVGSFSSNSYNIHDLSGNVWEWCQDWYDESDPKYRVLRGGSWLSYNSRALLSSRRSNGTPSNRLDGGGFRCVLEVGLGSGG